MGSKIKEDERSEKAIRSLLKLPANRRCINCNSLGPQYVCSTFWTFVCTNCSGIHREFTHRVKSISMAKFTIEEVSALGAGGNERARQIYFKEWDTQRDAYPDTSNILKLRDFIKSVYVDKRYTSESNDKISKQKPAIIEDFTESKNTSTNFFGSRSLRSLDNSEFERPSAIGRSGNESLKFYFDDKKHVTHNPKSRGLPKTPIRFEIVDDRFRDDGSVRRYDGRRESRVSSKSLDLSNNKYMPRLPLVHHTSKLLGEDPPHLRIENVEENKDQLNNQMTTSPSNKVENPGSLIDDVPACGSQHTPHSNDNINQISSELPASLKVPEDPTPHSLEDLLFGLYVAPTTNNSEVWTNSDSSSTANVPATNLGTHTISKIPNSVTSFVTSPTTSHSGFLGPTFHVATDNSNTQEMGIPSVNTNNQVTSTTSPKGASNISTEQSTLDISNSAHGVGLEHHHQDETKSSIRKALPEDLFTGGFSFASPQVHGQHHGMQYYQYPVAMGTFTYTTKPTNPFDLSCDDTSLNQTSQFPSMAYMQGGGLPHVSAPRGFSDSSSPAADSIGLMASHSPFYTTSLSPKSPYLASNLSPGAYMGQQSHVTISPSFRRHEINGPGTVENTFNATHTFHQANNGYPHANPNAYISRGNPFE